MKQEGRPQRNDSDFTSERPLQSWKEIAAYLERDERTARRWEKSAALPVRRHGEGKGSSVYAFPSELEAWRAARKPQSDELLGKKPQRRRNMAVFAAVLTVLFAAWFLTYSPILNPPNPLVQADGITLRQVWTGPEVDSTGRPSPDGRYLSCVVRPAGNVGIRELASGETRLLTRDAGWEESAYYSVFSPDGLRVAYEWGRRETDLRLVALDGSQDRVLCPREKGWWIEPVDWSADGRFILVRHYSGDPPNSYQIGMVSVEDGSLRILKTVTSASREKVNLWFSPDGDYVVYDHSSQGSLAERDISVLNVTDEDQFSLVEYPGDDYVLGWTPDGGSVLFASNRSGSYDAWQVPVIDGRPDANPAPLNRNIGRIHSLGFTTDGSFLYEQTGGDWDHDVYTVEIDFEMAQLLQSPQLAVQERIGNNWSLEWSPDGDYLAYVSKRADSKTYLLCIRNEESGEEEQLTPELSRLSQLHWSPDGRSFLAAGADLQGQKGWFLIDRDTASVSAVPIPERGGAVFDAQWFPSGKRILYGRNNGQEQWAQIAQLDLETGREEELLRLEGEGLLGFLALSPDGTKLTFTRWRLVREQPKTISLMVMPVVGGQRTELLSVEFPQAIGQLAWSDDGRFLIYGKALSVGSDQNSMELWTIEPEGGPARKLGITGNLLFREPIRVHPEGRRIAFTRAEKRAEIWAMEGFLTKDATSN